MTQNEFAPYAQSESESRGRRYTEAEHPYRPAFARDRDRIIHCRAFRRLEYKTQVFVNHEGDHYRTRLTHTIEVAQIARTVARALHLNEDLVESLSLSHDLGHTPFGHLGEDVLDQVMSDSGGFGHNRQSLRIVETLEQRYPKFPGLNLTFETREGIAKHSGPASVAHVPEAADYLPDVPPPLEAQMIDIVDEIAYNHHDLEDGLESKLLAFDDVVENVTTFGLAVARAHEEFASIERRMLVKIGLRAVIDKHVTDLIDATKRKLQRLDVRSLSDVRSQSEWLVGFTDERAAGNQRIKTYLRRQLYDHPRIQATKSFFSDVLSELFESYVAAPSEMPERFVSLADDEGIKRAACDYIAGMTDRFALQEHRRLCDGPGPENSPMATGRF